MTARILIVDDQRSNVEMIAGVLKARGYAVYTALDGQQALEQVREIHPDLVVSDILMPGMDGYDLCRRLRAAPETALLPVILVTSLDGQSERIKGLEAGADDFLSKPVNWEELFARVRSLLRVKALQDELKDVNAKLAERVRDQVSQLERLSRLKRFFSKPVAEAIVAGGEELLEPHRREITAVFLDLRGFTSFTDRADPDEVMDLLRAYHATLGRTVDQYEGTLEHFAGDGIMIFFSDPLPVDRPAERAVRMALALQEAFTPISPRHRHRPGRGDARRDRLRAALGVRRDRQRAEPRRAPVRRGARGRDHPRRADRDGHRADRGHRPDRPPDAARLRAAGGRVPAQSGPRFVSLGVLSTHSPMRAPAA